MDDYSIATQMFTIPEEFIDTLYQTKVPSDSVAAAWEEGYAC